MKLLVLNLQDPSRSRYVSVKDIGGYMWGKRLSNSPIYTVDEDGNMERLIVSSDVTHIEKCARDAIGAQQ